MDKIGKKLTKIGKNLSIGVTAPLLAIGNESLNAAADLETLNATLLTVFEGNEAAARSALSEITDFTAKTPFQLEKVSEAFVKLKNLGLDPSIEALRSYGNTASALGKDLDQFIEAVADASVNEFERLKEFGIKAKQEGENVSFTFQGVTRTIRKNGEEIQKYLQEIGNTTFAGGIEKQANTFKGAMSTLRDNLKLLLADFGEVIIEGLRPMIDRANQLIKVFKELSPETKAQIVAFAAFAASIGPIILLAGNLATSISAITAAVRTLTVAIAANPIGTLATVIAAAVVSYGIYNSLLEKTLEITKDLNDVESIAIKNTAKQRAELESLYFVAKSEKVSKEQRLKAIQELNKIAPEYLGNLTLETINTDKARAAIEEYNKVLLETARVRAAEAKIQEIQSQIIEQELTRAKQVGKAEQARADFIKAQVAAGLTYQEAVEKANLGLEIGNFLSDKKIQNLKEEQQLLLDIIKNSGDILAVQKKINSPTNGNGVASDLDLDIYDPADIDAFITELGGNVDRALEDAAVRAFQLKLDGFALEGTDLESVFGITEDDVEAFLANLERVREVARTVAESVANVFQGFSANIIESLGLAESGFQGFVKNLGQTVIKLISILLSNSIANAIAGATQSALATGPAAILSQPAFIATAVSGVLAAFAAIPKFAQGGFVDGPFSSGDKLLARVNAGELILNVAQQKNLANALTREPVVIGGGFVLEGDMVRLMLTRNGKKLDRRT